MAWARKCIARSSLLTKHICRLPGRQVQQCIWAREWHGFGTRHHDNRRQWLPSFTDTRWNHASGVEPAEKLNPSLIIEQLSSDNDNKVLKVTWSDGAVSRYNTSWLRMNCQCSACKQPDSGQMLVTIRDFPAQLTIHSSSHQHNSSSIAINFNEESDHQCTLPVSWLKQHSYSPADLEVKARLRDVKYLDSAIGSFRCEDVRNSEGDLFEWLDHLNTYGITILKNVPVCPESVTKVANMIGPVTETLYGHTFDVQTEDKPINVAYSSVGLGFHVDLAYYESPPGLQLLHCLQFDDMVLGGESIFLDGFCIAEEFREKFPHHFETLTRVPATFQKFHFERANPAAYIYQRPHINVNKTGQITAVTWSPPFEGPLAVPEEDVEPYYEAYREFSSQLEKSDKVVSYRLQQGDCVIFNNRRIFHGRMQFQQNGGVRHLKGCYVNIDDFRSKVQYLHEKRGLGQLAKRVGNQCMF